MGLFDNYQTGSNVGNVAGNFYDPLGMFAPKKKSGGSSAPQFQPYNGYRPPHIDYTDPNGKQVNNLRNVQQMITDTLMRRSQGQDVGYDPAMVQKSKENFNINQQQQDERNRADLTNELSGTGMSRNLAARDATLGRLSTDENREQNKAFNNIDIANMQASNQEKQAATAGLQGLNSFDFGQENNAANFDLGVYNAENNAQRGDYSSQLAGEQQAYDQSQSGLGDIANLALTGYGIYSGQGEAAAMAAALKGMSGSNQTSTPFGASIDPNTGSYAQPLNQSTAYSNALNKRLTNF